MRYLRQSTATVIEVGPFVDDTNGKDLEESLTVASIDVQLMQPLQTAAVPPDLITNGAFASDTGWTKNSWTISAGVANSAGAQSTSITQSVSITENVAYELVFNVVTQSAGSVLPILGTTSGTSRSTVAEFTETIIAGSGSLIDFDATSFTGTIDNVVVKQVPIPITPAASGSTNDMVLTQSNTGTYWLELTANQVGIVGRHKLTAFITGALIVWEEFMVVEEAVYDALFAASAGGFASISAMSAAQTDLDTLTAGVTLAADAITADKIADNAFLAINFGADFLTAVKIAPGAFVADNFAASSLNGKGDWNTVTPDAVGVAATQAEVATECAAALVAINLDHWVGTASGIPALPAGTYLDLLQDDGTATYNRTTDSLQAIRDNHPTNFSSLGIESDGDVTKVNLVATTTTNTDMITFANIWTGTLTESYAANGVAFTPAQGLYAIHQHNMEFAISSTNRTVKKLDSSATAFVEVLDDATNPTSLTR